MVEQADSLVWRYTDDIEFVLDYDKREVQYRSQTRLGQTDWDVQVRVWVSIYLCAYVRACVRVCVCSASSPLSLIVLRFLW